jgi:(2Fe-2S) ferredoxin
MPGRYEKHIFVCTNTRPADHPTPSCGPKGGLEIQKKFKERLAALGLKSKVRANQAGCLDNCQNGVTVVIYPHGIWYGHVTIGDIDEIIEKSVIGNEVVERLSLTR